MLTLICISTLWRCRLGDRNGTRPVRRQYVGGGGDSTETSHFLQFRFDTAATSVNSCRSKIHDGSTFWYTGLCRLSVPQNWPLKRVPLCYPGRIRNSVIVATPGYQRSRARGQKFLPGHGGLGVGRTQETVELQQFASLAHGWNGVQRGEGHKSVRGRAPDPLEPPMLHDNDDDGDGWRWHAATMYSSQLSGAADALLRVHHVLSAHLFQRVRRLGVVVRQRPALLRRLPVSARHRPLDHPRRRRPAPLRTQQPVDMGGRRRQAVDVQSALRAGRAVSVPLSGSPIPTRQRCASQLQLLVCIFIFIHHIGRIRIKQ